MIEIAHKNDLSRLRRIALNAQGLIQTAPFGRAAKGTRNAIHHIGYVQIDTISVVERAHHHVLYSRVPGFMPEMINELLVNGDIFEYWSHAAAFLPIEDYRYSLPYKHAIKSGKTHWHKNFDRKLMNELLARIRSEGPLRSRDIESNATKRPGWWDWKPAKKALEQLFMEGDLMVRGREGFQKTYDLTERVLPANIDATEPTLEAFAEHLLQQQLRCHGFASLKGLTYLRRNIDLRKAMKTLVEDQLATGSLEEFQLTNGERFVTEAGALDRPTPRLNRRLAILSPFDNSVIQRERLKSIFDYQYQIECYVPAAKRNYGYFCLPLLYRGEFIGRMDCKAHRKEQHFEIKSLHFESLNFDRDALITAFAEAVKQFCRFQQCHSVSLNKTSPEKFTQPVRAALTRVL